MFRTLVFPAPVSALLVCALLGASGAAEPIGSAFEITGSVTGQPPGEQRRVLSPGSDVHFKEHIRARSAARGQFRFIDGSRFVVGGGSEVVLDEFVFRGGASRAVLHVSEGALRFLGSGARSGRDRMTVTTPVAVVGIRGTVVDVTHRSGRTAFLLLHGSAEVCRRNGGCQLVTEPCTGVLVEGDVSGIQRRDAAALAVDFPLLAAQRELWPDYRANLTCGVAAAVDPTPRDRGRGSDDPDGRDQSNGDGGQTAGDG